jgi:energy-converting hydrogenase B subunit D
MIELLGHAFVLAGLVIAAAVIVTFRDLLSAAIAFGIFSFLLSLEFFILQAPDVAIAEAGIGAGLTTAIYIVAIRGTHRWEEEA